MDYKKTIKDLLQIKGSDQDASLSFCIDSTIQSILNYCNIDSIPVGLQYVVVEASIGQFQELTRKLSDQADTGPIASIKRGDTQITYATTNDGGSGGQGGMLNKWLVTHKEALHCFRRIRVMAHE